MFFQQSEVEKRLSKIKIKKDPLNFGNYNALFYFSKFSDGEKRVEGRQKQIAVG